MNSSVLFLTEQSHGKKSSSTTDQALKKYTSPGTGGQLQKDRTLLCLNAGASAATAL